jgi:hypothetical protein
MGSKRGKPLARRGYIKTKLRYSPYEEGIPLDFLPSLWREAVIDGEVVGRPRINRITYEIATRNNLFSTMGSAPGS